jgi:ABC-type multidrug transport system fused ATPase/permease subunit
VIGGIILLVFISPKLTLMMLAIVPVVAVAAVIFGRFIRKTSRQVQEKIAESNTIIEETLQGITNVKAFANEFFENKRYRSSTEEIVKIGILGGKYRGAFASFIIFCLFGAIVAVIWYGVVLASQNQLLIGDLISFILYSAFVGASFGGIAELYAQIQKAVGAVERVFEILDEEAEVLDISAPQGIKNRIEGKVVFKNVAFTYPSRKEIQVLKNISFEGKKGETIAIVGPSGSGKSTLVGLLLRFYNVESGKILIDDKECESYNLTDLRNNMAIVPQDVLLFGGSIKENIAYGKPNASIEEIEEAAKKANAFDFIESFPEKFDTLVGERGIKLSGGERQRIAIARAIIKDSPILLLDEATSALDNQNEKYINQAMFNFARDKTVITVAHKLSSIIKAEKIIFLKDGQIVESGTHQELVSKNGFYQKMYEAEIVEEVK